LDLSVKLRLKSFFCLLGGVADCVSKLIFRQGVSPDLLSKILQQKGENEPTEQTFQQGREEKLEGNHGDS